MSGNILIFIAYVVIAFIVGTVAQLVTGYHKHRIFTTMILGLIGVIAGDLASKKFGFPDFHLFDISIFWSFAGAIIFILLFRLIRGRW